MSRMESKNRLGQLELSPVLLTFNVLLNARSALHNFSAPVHLTAMQLCESDI